VDKETTMEDETSLDERLDKNGVSRREFLKYCSVVAAAIGLGPGFGPKLMEAFAATRPRVLWLHFAECTGCTEAALRTTAPTFDTLIFNNISLDYHETLMAGAGEPVELLLSDTASRYSGQFFCVVEGAIPTASGGIYGKIGSKTMLGIAQEICPKSKAVIAMGNCSSFGGLPAAAPNPTGAKGVRAALGTSLTVPVINLPGCPPNPINFVGVIANYLLLNKLPTLDSNKRPTFAYGKKVHDQCPFREGSQEKRCLEDHGCKGKRCYNNCPSIKFNNGTNFPMGANHPCIGCSEPNFWDTMTPFYKEND
jgi:[NiFe] hydrogenase small subunit